MTIARDLAEWALSLKLDDVWETKVQRDACLHMADGIGCAIAAVRTKEAPYAIGAALQMGGPKEASIISDGARVSAPAAAFANGVLMHAHDFDDTHTGALVHATSTVVPAALAVGEETSTSGAGVLVSAIAGYEVVARLGAAIKHGFHSRGFHATSVCGVFASALVASKLMGLTVGQTVNALGIAGSLSAGSLEFLHTGSATKQLHPGLSSMNGIVAARLAAAGAEGPDSIFEGPYGLYQTHAGAEVDSASVTRGLGDEWEISLTAIKYFPACHLSIASLEAIRGLRPKNVDDIESITFSMPDESVAIVCEPASEKQNPRTAYEAKFSLPFCAASLLIDGNLTIDSFSVEMRTRPQVLSLAKRVGYAPLRIPVRLPPADAPGVVRIHYRDGSVVQNESGAGAYGSGVIDEIALIDKFRANGGTDDLLQTILGLPELPDVKGIFA